MQIYFGAAAAASDASARRAAANKSSEVIPFVLQIAFFVCLISLRNVFERVFASFWLSLNNRKRSATGSAARASMETQAKQNAVPLDIIQRKLSMRDIKITQGIAYSARRSHQRVRAAQQAAPNINTVQQGVALRRAPS